MVVQVHIHLTGSTETNAQTLVKQTGSIPRYKVGSIEIIHGTIEFMVRTIQGIECFILVAAAVTTAQIICTCHYCPSFINGIGGLQACHESGYFHCFLVFPCLIIEGTVYVPVTVFISKVSSHRLQIAGMGRFSGCISCFQTQIHEQ